MNSLVTDVRHAVRAIRKRPGISLAIALTLGLGLGLNVTVLGMLDALMLRPFQFAEYDRLVILRETVHGSGKAEPVAPANFIEWRNEVERVERLAAWEWWDTTLTGREAPERIAGHRVSPGFFELLGVRTTLGRTFTQAEEQPGNDRQVVLGDGLWRRRFGADPLIVGTSIQLDGEPYTVVGVAQPRFAFPAGAEAWVPLVLAGERAADRENRSLTVGGKLRKGETLETARAELEVIGRRLEATYPENSDRGLMIATLNDAFRESGSGAVVGILQAGAGLVLLVACANIAGLLLARGMDRQHEFALRTALGATRGSLIRLLVTETVVLAVVASILAVALAAGALEVMRTSMPAEMARFIEGWDNLRLNTRMLLLMPAFAIGLGLTVGLWPAMAASRAAVAGNLNEGGRSVTGGRKRQRARRALVVAEIAFALALLIAASLTVAGGAQLANRPGGFAPDGLLTAEMQLPENKYGEPVAIREFAAALQAKLSVVNSIEHIAFANILPAGGWSPSGSFSIEGDPAPEPGRRPQTGYRIVSPNYFETMGIPVRGRMFTEQDREGAMPVAIVSEAMARRHFPGQDPVGRRLRAERLGDEWLTIVGVAGDVSMFNWWEGEEDFAATYVSMLQIRPGRMVQAVLRTRTEPGSVAPTLRAVVGSIDPLLPLRARTMRQAIADNGLGLAYMASLMGVCGAVALLLAAVGISSVMAYEVAQRTQEIGVRMALGATPGDILKMTLTQAGWVTAAGVGLGLAFAIALGLGMRSALFGMIPLNAPAFALAAGVLALIAMAAAYVPARRTLKIDPAVVLRAR